jgi:hypothetical protein
MDDSSFQGDFLQAIYETYEHLRTKKCH